MMKVNKAICTVFLSIITISVARTQTLTALEVLDIVSTHRYFPTVRDFRTREKIDDLSLRVGYNFSYLTDTVSGKSYSEPFILEIGKQLNHFYSYNAHIRDSIQIAVYEEEKRNNFDVFTDVTGSVIPRDQTATYYDIYRYLRESSREIILRIENIDYRYSEKIEPIEWTITGDEETIVGYRCLAAKGWYGGRQWNVAFTLDIPYSAGPWKLEGLPGLILRAEDSDGLFLFEAYGLEKGKGRGIYRYTDKIKSETIPYRTQKAEKKEIANLWKRICLAPHTIPYLFRSDQNMKVMLPDGSVRTIGISLNFPNDVYYPRLELE